MHYPFASLVLLVILLVHAEISAGGIIRDDDNSIKSIQQTFMSLLDFTHLHAYTSKFHVTFSTMNLPALSYRSGKFNATKVFDLFVHMDEMCPDELDECWCGFVEELKNYNLNFTNKNLVFLKMCSSESTWKKSKNEIPFQTFSAFRMIEISNGTKYELDQELRDKFYQQVQEKRKIESDEAWNSMELNKHDERWCPYRFEWCWCGIIGNSMDYLKGIRSTTIVETPRFMIDCRKTQKRLYETRNCTVQTGASLPWYKKLLGSSKTLFPCGHY